MDTGSSCMYLFITLYACHLIERIEALLMAQNHAYHMLSPLVITAMM